MQNKQPSRKKAFITQAVGGYILTIISIVKGLLLLPLYFQYISYDMYGYWITIGSIVSLISVINFGIGTMVMQRISKAYAKKDFQEIGNYFMSSLFVYIFISVIFLSLGFILSLWLENILHISAEELKDLKVAFYIALFTMMISFFSNAFRGFAGALLKPLFGIKVMITSNLFGIFLVIFLLNNNFGLLSLPISLLVTELLIVILCGIYVLVLYKNFNIKSKIKLIILKEYFTFSPHLFGLVIGNKLLENSHPIIITTFLGSEVTTAYDVTRKVIDIILRALHVLNASLLAPFSHLVGEGDKTHIQQTTIKIIRISFLMVILGYSVYISTNYMFVSLWLGKDVTLDQNIILFIGLSAFIFSINRLLRSLLFGFNEIKFATNSVLKEGLVYLLLSYILINIYGVIAIPISMLLASSYFLWKLWMKISENINITVKKMIIIKNFIMLLTIFILLCISDLITIDNSWLLFITKVCTITFLIVIIEILFYFDYIKQEISYKGAKFEE